MGISFEVLLDSLTDGAGTAERLGTNVGGGDGVLTMKFLERFFFFSMQYITINDEPINKVRGPIRPPTTTPTVTVEI